MNLPDLIDAIGKLDRADLAALLAAIASRMAQPPVAADVDQSTALVTAKQLAAKLNVTEAWIRERVRTNQIPFVRLGRYIRFDPARVAHTLQRK